MSTYTQFLYQLVFGSKNHLPFISSKNQAEHHRTISFKDELIELLNEHGVDFKDEYLFI
jgi:hypothetical protein